MKEELQRLLDLQEVDSEAVRLREQLNLYPPMLEQIDKNLSRKMKEFSALENSKKELNKERRSLEKDIEYKEEQIKKKQEQQLTPKIKQDAYDALKHEMELLRAEINDLEDKVLANINKEEELEQTIARASEKIKVEEEDAQMEHERIEKQIDRKKKRLDELEKDRESKLELVPPKLLAYYKRFFQSYGPDIVVPVQGDSCGGCHMRILPQVLVEIHRGDKIVYCEGCRRILIGEQDRSAE